MLPPRWFPVGCNGGVGGNSRTNMLTLDGWEVYFSLKLIHRIRFYYKCVIMLITKNIKLMILSQTNTLNLVCILPIYVYITNTFVDIWPYIPSPSLISLLPSPSYSFKPPFPLQWSSRATSDTPMGIILFPVLTICIIGGYLLCLSVCVFVCV